MDVLHIPHLTTAGHTPAEQIIRMLDTESAAWHTLTQVNWKAFPYQPSVSFRIAHTETHLLVHFHVIEQSVRAVAQHDNDRVWEDSCVELFISPDGNDTYYNFECNCAGKLLIEYGQPGRRERAPLHITSGVHRWSSLGSEPFDTQDGTMWDLTLSIPATALYHHDLHTWTAGRMKGNLYKCGDKLPEPHFLSFYPITLPEPCFHCPDFFQGMNFE